MKKVANNHHLGDTPRKSDLRLTDLQEPESSLSNVFASTAGERNAMLGDLMS